MPMPKESFEGKWLRDRAEMYKIEVNGLTDKEIREKCYDALKDKDIGAALEYKFGNGWDKWSDEEWNEALSTIGPEKGLTIPLTRRKYFQRVEKAVKEKFPKFEGCYNDSFVICLVAITNGEEEKIGSVLEQLANHHAGYDSKEELSVFGSGYTGDMLSLLYQTSRIKI